MENGPSSRAQHVFCSGMVLMGITTRILEVGDNPQRHAALEEAAQLLRDGQLVAFPTETVYGLGGDAGRADVIDKIFAAKNRPSDNPLIVHLDHLDRVADYCSEIPQALTALAKAFWPGPLTVVLPATEKVKNTVCRGLETVAVRIPNHPIALELIKRADMGLAAPSANLSGRPSPTRAEHVYQDMQGRIPLILDGGPCQVGIESTVLDLTDQRPAILRPGMVTRSNLESVLGCEILKADKVDALRRSPGTRYRHYSPSAPVYVVTQDVSEEAFLALVHYLAEEGRLGYLGSRKPVLCSHIQVEPQELAQHLYRGLRELDDQECCGIIVESPGKGEVGDSVMDRLKKAASFYFESDAQTHRFIAEGLD